MNLTELSKEVHADAVAHGLWNKKVEFYEVVPLMHEKLSSALREYRNDRLMKYYLCDLINEPCFGEECVCFSSTCIYKEDKPEGVAVELCDCILRILDWFGYCGTDVQKVCEDAKLPSEAKFKSFMDFLSTQHAKLSLALLRYAMNDEPRCNYNLAVCINQISDWLSQNYGENWKEVLLRKHEHNKIYKRGGLSA